MHTETFSFKGKYWCGSQCERVNGFTAVEGAELRLQAIPRKNSAMI